MRGKWLIGIWLTVIVSVFANAQGFRRFFFGENEPPPTELIIARWQYQAMGKFGGTGWSHNYPTSDQHIAQVISEATSINITNMSYRIVELGSPEVFDYPFAIVSEPGEMRLTQKEVVNLREYVERGGFVVMDDFDGPQDLAVLRGQLKRAFPEREMVRLTIDHPVFHMFYDIDALNITSPYLVGGEADFYGLMNEKGDLAIVACHNNDLEDFWDWIDRERYPLKPSVEAFRLGIDFVLYAMTH